MPATVVTNITSFLELVPGVRATPARLEALLQDIKEDVEVCLGGGTVANPKHGVTITTFGDDDDDDKEPDEMVLRVCPPFAKSAGRTGVETPLYTKKYPISTDGLMRAIVDAKTVIAEEKLRVLCPGCPLRMMTMRGLPKCRNCVLTEAMGI